MVIRSWSSVDPSRRARIAVRLPAALLVLVAGTQMVLARTADLSPWKGGGFGMFSSIDGLSFRDVRIFIRAEGRAEELALPPSLMDAAARAAAFPRPRQLRGLAAAVIERERRAERPIESIRLEVSRVRISPSMDSTSIILCDFTAHANGRTDAASQHARRTPAPPDH